MGEKGEESRGVSWPALGYPQFYGNFRPFSGADPSFLCEYLNNIIEQDHWRIKRNTRPMLGFKNFYAAQRTLAGMEVMVMIKKGQMKIRTDKEHMPAQMFYALAA